MAELNTTTIEATLEQETPVITATMSNASYRGSPPIKGVDYWTEEDKREIVDAAKEEVAQGAKGESAYEVAVNNGFVGTEEEWLASLKGPAPEFGIGEVTTTEPGTEAAVTNVGTDGNIKLNFSIPRGDKGDRGEKGNDGVSPVISVQRTENGVTIVATDAQGTTSATVKDGESGEQGIQGPAGPQGKSSVYVGSEEPTDDSLVWIDTDGEPSVPSGATAAISVSFDNSTSGLTATNVQSAIDELVTKINSLVDGNEVSY